MINQRKSEYPFTKFNGNQDNFTKKNRVFSVIKINRVQTLNQEAIALANAISENYKEFIL